MRVESSKTPPCLTGVRSSEVVSPLRWAVSRHLLESFSVLSERARDGRRELPEQVLAIGVVTTFLTMWPWCVWCGSLVAQDIGSSLLTGDAAPAFFVGLLDELARWWESLGPTGQLLVTALGVMLLMSAGSTFALAMGAVGF